MSIAVLQPHITKIMYNYVFEQKMLSLVAFGQWVLPGRIFDSNAFFVYFCPN